MLAWSCFAVCLGSKADRFCGFVLMLIPDEGTVLQWGTGIDVTLQPLSLYRLPIR